MSVLLRVWCGDGDGAMRPDAANRPAIPAESAMRKTTTTMKTMTRRRMAVAARRVVSLTKRARASAY